ncbi:MAG: 4Fe-4S dicluster domain-containing protein [Pseudomonadota bacterium]
MTKWNLIFDADRCNNCNNCLLAVKDEYVGNAFPGYSAPMPATGAVWLNVARKERGQAPMIDVSHYVDTCMNCREPACVNAQTDGVVHQRDDGIVLIDPVAAKGRKDIVAACPYGHIHWNAELDLPQKWTLDAHLLDAGWSEPRAAQVCPTSALTILKAEDDAMDARVAAGELSPRGGSTGPRLFDKNFERVTKCFLGATVTVQRGDLEDCAEGIAVQLKRDGVVIAGQTTDAFGDFKFDGLEGQGETYEIVIGQRTIDVTLNDSRYLGTFTST